MGFNLADLFEAAADAAPDREVLVAGERRLTYRQLDERANRLAHHLADRGIGPEATVGLQLKNGTEYLEGMLAAYKLRVVPVNINYRYVERELRHLYEDADLAALLYHREFAPRVASAAGDIDLLLTVEDGSDADPVPGATTYDDALAGASPERPDVAGRSSDDLYIVYTGGTTGMPKGVVWRHEDIFKAAMGGGDLAQQGNHVSGPDELAQRVRDQEQGLTALAAPPLMHASAHWLAFHQLYTGGKVILLDRGRFDPPDVWRTIAEEQVFMLVLVGDAMAKPLLDELADDPERYDPSSLWVIASSGAVLSRSTKERLLELLPERMVVDAFGSSETGPLGQRGEPGTFTVGDDVAVMDDNGRKVEPGSGRTGRLARRGHVPLRYLGDPQKTAETFVELDGERWALTGDEAQVEDDGTVTLLGRGSQSINTGGEKVYPEEVEEALRGHGGVRDVVVVGVPDERWGERVTAVVQPADGADLDLEVVQGHARDHLAGYKVPRALVLVDEVVRSPAGKPDYAWAKRAAAEADGAEVSA